MVDYYKGKVAVAHNGQLTNAKRLREEFEANGSIFHTTSDTEVIVHLMAKPLNMMQKNLSLVLQQLRGAFSLLFLTPDEMVGVRDPHGFRPLSLGRLKDGYVMASETCALDQVGAEYIRDINPGEAVYVGRDGIRSEYYCPQKQIKPAFVFSNWSTFRDPIARIYGESVHLFRKRLGAKLAKGVAGRG